MRCYVEYRVPVLVEVDLDEGRVVSVDVDDEQVEGPVGVIVVAAAGMSEADEMNADRVTEEGSWPAWDLQVLAEVTEQVERHRLRGQQVPRRSPWVDTDGVR